MPRKKPCPRFIPREMPEGIHPAKHPMEGGFSLDKFLPNLSPEAAEALGQMLDDMETAKENGRKAADDAASVLDLLSRVRFALGDNGKRMQAELLEYCAELRGAAGALAALDEDFQRVKAERDGAIQRHDEMVRLHSGLTAERDHLRARVASLEESARLNAEEYIKAQAETTRWAARCGVEKGLREQAEARVAELEALHHGWIKVSDRLPDPWGRVLIWVPEEGGHLCATFTQGTFFHSGHQERPTHWMPLPEPPKP